MPLTMSALYRLWLAFGPRPSGIRRAMLLKILHPAQGEQMLEVGPGGGYYSRAVAGRLQANGRLVLVDIDRGMLDFTLRRLRSRGLESSVQAFQSDATSLPFEDRSFDAAFLVAVLGEVTDPPAALRELFRVIRDGGRLVVGEALVDPHALPPDQLRRDASDAGFEFDRRTGGRSSYLVRFRRPRRGRNRQLTIE